MKDGRKLAEMVDVIDAPQQLDLAPQDEEALTEPSVADITRNLSVKGVINGLLKDKYIASERLARQSIAALNTRPVAGFFGFGGAGCGKTQLAKSLAKRVVRASKTIFFQCFAGVRDEDFFIKLLPCEDTKSGIRSHEGPIIQALRASLEGRTCLILDEWDKSKPSSDAILLNLLQECRAVYNDVDLFGNPDNLVVMITMNDERYLSEPGLRRYSKIDFDIMHPQLVYSALQLYHPNHPYLEAAVNLYCRWYQAGIYKPCTVQELVQLLDAINILGKDGVWDELVRQFVTKDATNHARLVSVEGGGPVTWNEGGRAIPVSMESSYMTGAPVDKDKKSKKVHHAKVQKLKHIVDRINHDFPKHASPEAKDVYVFVDASVEAYNKLARAAKAPGVDPALIESAIVTEDGAIKMTRPWELSKWKEFPLWGHEGEATFSVTHNGLLTWETFKKVCDNVSAMITRFDKFIITARVFDSDGVDGEIIADLKWTQKGLEVISSLHHNHTVNNVAYMMASLEAEEKRKKELKEREKARKAAGDKDDTPPPIAMGDNVWSFVINGTNVMFLYEKGYLYLYIGSDPNSPGHDIAESFWTDEGSATPERFGMFYLGHGFGDVVSKDGRVYRRDAVKIPSGDITSKVLYWLTKIERFTGTKAKEVK